MKTTFSRRILVIFASATAYLAFTGVTHAHESGLLMGGLYSVGDDGAAETGENPAFLATSKRTQGKSAHARTTAYNAGNIVVSALPVTDTTQVTGAMDLAMGWHRIAGSRWSAGLAVGDVRSPIYQRLALEGSQLSPLTGLNVSIKTLNVDQSHGLSAALAWHLTAKESIGLRLSYRHRYAQLSLPCPRG